MNRILGVDYGARRVGIAISDPLGLGATPLEVVDRSKALARISRLVEEQEVGMIVVGLPTGLSGGEGRSAEEARNFGAELERQTEAEVIFQDERFTSRIAEQRLLDAGMKRRERRATVDRMAAAIILQDYLDGRK